ncbi:MAG: CoA transferase subunit A [Candidatus Helarchaeota archaeon]
MAKEKVMTVEDAVGLIKDGDNVAFGGVLMNMKPIALMWEIIRQQKRDLTVTILTGNFGLDAMIGMDCVKALNTIYVGFEQLGFAPNFQRRAQEGTLHVNEFTEMQFFWAMRAAEMGVPYLPCRSGLGSELLDVNPYLSEIEFEGERLVAVKAIHPDVTIIHSMVGDHYGNIQLENLKTYMEDSIARSVKDGGKVIVSVEKLVDTEYIYRNPKNTILNNFEVDAVVEVPYGAHPGMVPHLYFNDMAFQMNFSDILKKERRLQRFFEKKIFPHKTRKDYLEAFNLKLGPWWEERT